jgi:uncharacterized coiled-coil protein SlyX
MSDSTEMDAMRQRQQVVEEAVMHLQHDVSKLNAALVDQQFQLGRIQRLLQDVDERLQRIDPERSEPGEKRDPLVEKPPHY